MSYFEHPDYVPLLKRSYTLWRELNFARKEHLFHKTGIVYLGDPSGAIIRGVQASSTLHNLPLTTYQPGELESIIPGIVPPSGAVCLFEENAGYLRVEASVLAMVQQGLQSGATLHHDETVQRWSATQEGVQVETDQQTYTAQKLIITAGPWANHLLADLGIPLTILRKHLHWFSHGNECYRESHGFPCFFMENNEGCFYGFPSTSPLGFKLAEHSGGTPIDDPLADPRTPDPEDDRRILEFLEKHLPGISRQRTAHETCFYTMTRTGNFVLDWHPQSSHVAFAAGLSGHGYKFAPVLGELLVEMAMDGRSSLAIDFLSLNQPGIFDS